MKTFDLNSMGIQEMSVLEMQETDGGLILLLIAAAIILIGASSCQIQINNQISGGNSTMTCGSQHADSTLNGNEGRLVVDK